MEVVLGVATDCSMSHCHVTCEKVAIPYWYLRLSINLYVPRGIHTAYHINFTQAAAFEGQFNFCIQVLNDKLSCQPFVRY